MLYAASSFETVEITQLNESCFANNLFLGSQNVNWVQLISEMLGSGLKALNLKNVYTPLIDHHDVGHIIEVSLVMRLGLQVRYQNNDLVIVEVTRASERVIIDSLKNDQFYR